MNFSNYRITLDVQSMVSQVSLPIRQGDTGRKIYINLTDGGQPYTIEDGCLAVFFARKADGNPIGRSCIIERNTTIVYELSEQTTTAPGIVDCEIRLYDTTNHLITSPRFILVVSDRVVTDDDFPISAADRSIIDEILSNETARVGAETERVEAEKRREAAMTELEERADNAIDLAEEAMKIANSEAIVNAVLEALPTWEGGSY